MYIINCLDTTAVRNTLRALLLTALIVVVFVVSYYAAAAVLPVIVAALLAAVAFVAHVVAADAGNQLAHGGRRCQGAGAELRGGGMFRIHVGLRRCDCGATR